MALIRAHEVDLGANYGSTIGGAIERGQQMALNSQADQRAERSLGLMETRDARQVEQLQKNETLMAQQQQQAAASAKQQQAEAQKLQTLTARCAKGDKNACSMLPSDARLKVAKAQEQEFKNRGVDSEFKQKDHADYSRGLQLKSYDEQTKSLQKRVQRMKEEGRDAADTQSILDITDPLQRNQVIDGYVSATENILALNEDRRKESKEAREQTKYDAEVEALNNPQAVADKSMVMTPAQKKNYSYYKSVKQAESALNKHLSNNKDFSPTSRLDALQDLALPDQQGRRIYDQNIRAWAIPYLRKTSGAAISEDEYDQVRAFFPAAGDGPEVVALKKKQREEIMQGILNESAPEGWYSTDENGNRYLDPKKMPKSEGGTAVAKEGAEANQSTSGSASGPSKGTLTAEQVTSEVDALMAEF